MKNDIEEIITAIKEFRDERDWEQYHKPKDLAICLSVEASELLELFLWKEESSEVNKVKVGKELADVFYSAFLLADKYGFDIKDLVLNKLIENRDKYPVSKSKGSNKKYDEL